MLPRSCKLLRCNKSSHSALSADAVPVWFGASMEHVRLDALYASQYMYMAGDRRQLLHIQAPNEFLCAWEST